MADALPTIRPAADPDEVKPGDSDRRRSARVSRRNSILSKIAVALMALVAWQVTVDLALPDYLPTPFGILRVAPSTLVSADFLSAMGATFLSVLIALVLGCLVGTMLGLAIGRLWWFRSLAAPYISGLYATPLLAIVPMMTIWLGYSSQARFAVIFLSAVLPCAVSTADGARSIPVQLADVARVLRVSRWKFVADVVLPSSLPFIVAGVQVAVGRALVAAVAVEYLASIDGLGTYILTNARTFQQNEAFVAVVFLALGGLLARVASKSALRWLAPWYDV